MPADFTLAAFAEICRRAAQQRTLTVADYLRTAPCAPLVILRFDVDYREPFALRLALLLARERVPGTFYFRHHATGFGWHTMTAIAALGHEVGYHYETLDRCQGDRKAAAEMFMADVAALRAGGIELQTVAAHGAPPANDTYTGNLDLLRAEPSLLVQAGLHGDAVASVDFERLTYYSDAGWRWRRCDGTPPGESAQATSFADLLARLAQPDAAFYINIHPQQWYARASNMQVYRWRNRLGMRIVPLLRGLRRTLSGEQARHQQ